MARAFLTRSIFFLAPFICLSSGCGPGLCLDSCSGSLSASVGAEGVDFGVRGFGSTTDISVVLVNESSNSAAGLSGAAVDAPFSFAGGAFPGTGGTCSDLLGGGQSCTFVLRFTAPGPPEGSSASVLEIEYLDGDDSKVLSLPVRGANGNGPFNLTRGFNAAPAALAHTSLGIVVVGDFLSLSDTPAPRIVRLTPAYTIDTSFQAGQGFDSYPSSIAEAQDGSGDLYVGGNFSSYNGTANVNALARLNSDGTLDTTFDIGSGASAGFTGAVLDLAPATDGSGDIYVVGNFVAYKGTANINHIVRLNSNGSIDSSFDIGAGATAGFNNFWVNSIAVARDGSGDVYVGGPFTSYRGTANVNRIVRLNSDGTRDLAFDIGVGAGAGFNGFSVEAIAPAQDLSGDVYVAGVFTSYNGTPNVNYIARLNSDGSLDSGFNIGVGATAGFNMQVYSIAITSSGDLYCSGPFSSYNGTANINGIVRLNSDGTIDSEFDIGSGPSAGVDGWAQHAVLTPPDASGNVFVTGATSYRGTPVGFLILLKNDGSIDSSLDIGTSFNGGFNSWLSDVSPARDGSGDVYVGGDFTSFAGVPNVNRIARLNSDGTLDTGFNFGTGSSAGFSSVSVIEPAQGGSGDVYVGGGFTSYNGTANINRIVRLNSDGTIDSGFNIGSGASAGFNISVTAVVDTTDGSGDVYVGGGFTTYNGATNINRIVRLNGNGSIDSGFNIGAGPTAGFDSTVYSIAEATDGSGDVYVVGDFTSYKGTANINRIVRLNSDGSVDSGFDIGTGPSAGLDAFVLSITPAADGSGSVYAGGWFSSYKGTTNVNSIARIKSDGTLDTVFNTGSGATAGFNERVASIVAPQDGSGDIYVAGQFTRYYTTNIRYLLRLNSDGSIDPGFDTGAGTTAGFNSYLYVIAPALDGSGDIYAGGNFSSYKGNTAFYAARVSSAGDID